MKKEHKYKTKNGETVKKYLVTSKKWEELKDGDIVEIVFINNKGKIIPDEDVINKDEISGDLISEDFKGWKSIDKMPNKVVHVKSFFDFSGRKI